MSRDIPLNATKWRAPSPDPTLARAATTASFEGESANPDLEVAARYQDYVTPQYTRKEPTFWEKRGFFGAFSDMQLVSSWFIPAPWVMVMRLVFAIVMVTFLALNIQKHFSAEYFASFFNLNFLFLGIYYAIMGVGGVYYVITYGKGKTYVFPSATLRKLMFMYGPIQAPLSVIGVIAYWLIRGAEGDTSYISIFTHGISIVLVLCDFFVLQRLPLVWGNLYVLQFTVVGYIFLSWIVTSFCSACKFTFWDSNTSFNTAWENPASGLAWLFLLITVLSYALSFFLFLWFIRWRDTWGKSVQRRKLYDLRYPNVDTDEWEIYDEHNAKWNAYLTALRAQVTAAWKSTMDRNAGKDISDRDEGDGYTGTLARGRSATLDRLKEADPEVPDFAAERTSTDDRLMEPEHDDVKQWWQAWISPNATGFTSPRYFAKLRGASGHLSPESALLPPTETPPEVPPTPASDAVPATATQENDDGNLPPPIDVVVRKATIDGGGIKRPRVPGMVRAPTYPTNDISSPTTSLPPGTLERFVTAPRTQPGTSEFATAPRALAENGTRPRHAATLPRVPDVDVDTPDPSIDESTPSVADLPGSYPFADPASLQESSSDDSSDDGSDDDDSDSDFGSARASVDSMALGNRVPTMKSVRIDDVPVPPEVVVGTNGSAVGAPTRTATLSRAATLSKAPTRTNTLDQAKPTIWTKLTQLFFTDTPALPSPSTLELASDPSYERTEEFFDPMEDMPRTLASSTSQPWYKILM